MDRQPSFLCEPAWAAVVESARDHHDFGSHVHLLVEHFQQLDTLSLVRSRTNRMVDTGEYDGPTVRRLVETLKCLRLAVRDGLLSSENDSSSSRSSQTQRVMAVASILLCKSALANLVVDIEILGLLSMLRAAESDPWEAAALAELVCSFGIKEGKGAGETHRSEAICRSLRHNLDAEVGFLLAFATHSYQDALLVSALNCRRLAAVYQAMYASIQVSGEQFHQIWHHVISLFGMPCQ